MSKVTDKELLAICSMMILETEHSQIAKEVE